MTSTLAAFTCILITRLPGSSGSSMCVRRTHLAWVPPFFRPMEEETAFPLLMASISYVFTVQVHTRTNIMDWLFNRVEAFDHTLYFSNSSYVLGPEFEVRRLEKCGFSRVAM